MDILTLILTEQVLKQRSIRQVARDQGVSASTVSEAINRIEGVIAVPLVRREGNGLLPTAEAGQRQPQFSQLAQRIRSFLAAAGNGGIRIPSINLDTLLRFSVVSHTGSIRRAARDLGVGQPQLTRQMRDLERRLEANLFDRTPSGVRLTNLGRRLLPLVEEVVADWEQMSRPAAHRFRREMATWHVGTVVPLGHESSMARLLANLVVQWAPMQARHPLHVTSQTADELLAGLKARRLDLVVLDHDRIPRELHRQTLSVTPLALVGPDGSECDTTPLPDLLARHPLVLPSRRSGIGIEAMRYLETQLPADALAALTVTEVESIPVIINLVSNHGYLSCLPLGSLQKLPQRLSHRSLAPDHMQHLSMVWRRSGVPEALLDAFNRASMLEHVVAAKPG